MRVAVIGAGPAGMTAAYQLTHGGAQVEVFEAGGDVGGMSRTIELWGQKADLGPHRFFSTDPRVNRIWSKVVGDDYQWIDRLTRIYYNNRFFYYPLQPANALWNMGVREAARCTASYVHQQMPKLRTDSKGREEAQADTFESWVVNRFGRRLFEMFFKSYSEKLWGISCQELDADFAAQRIKKLSLGEAVKGAIGIGKQKHKTLVDRFAYPLEGTGSIYQRMADSVRKSGGKIHFHQPVRRVLSEHRQFHVARPDSRTLYDFHLVRGIETADGRQSRFDHVISTMPLTLLVKGLEGAGAEVRQAADSLTFRNTILVYLLVEGGDLFPDQWLYIHSPDLQMGRVTNFRNWAKTLCGDSSDTVLTIEYWCYDDDPVWSASEKELTALASQELRQTGLLRDRAVLEGHIHKIRRSYPVYRTGYKEHLDKVASHLHTYRGLTAIGRYGAFKYNNQDHSILMGILAAENLLSKSKHDLWLINTDYETYQESSRIDESQIGQMRKAA